MKPAPPVIRYLAIISPDRIVSKAHFAQICRLVDVAAIENDRVGEQILDTAEIRTAELIPFGHDQQSGGAVERIVIAVRVLNAVAEYLARLFHRLGIESLHPGSSSEQGFDDVNRRRVAHIIGAR